MPQEVAGPIADAIDSAVVAQSWAHQPLLNLHPELGKSSGGFRSIAETPKLYRLWARTHKRSIQKWESTLEKGCDPACKGSSALVAASTRSLFAEVAIRNGKKTCGSFFDIEKFLIQSSQDRYAVLFSKLLSLL